MKSWISARKMVPTVSVIAFTILIACGELQSAPLTSYQNFSDFQIGDFRNAFRSPIKLATPLMKLGDKCYYLQIILKANYYSANQFCKFHGMDLVSISSEGENAALLKYFGDFGYDQDRFWTSGTDLADGGSWFWFSTGLPFTYANWQNGLIPNNANPYSSGEQSRCLEIWKSDGSNFFWNSAPCLERKPFMCECNCKAISDEDAIASPPWE